MSSDRSAIKQIHQQSGRGAADDTPSYAWEKVFLAFPKCILITLPNCATATRTVPLPRHPVVQGFL